MPYIWTQQTNKQTKTQHEHEHKTKHCAGCFRCTGYFIRLWSDSLRSCNSLLITNPVKNHHTMNRTLKKELASYLLDALNDKRLTDRECSEIHNEVFNSDYYIIGRYEAEQFLTHQECGVFGAISEIVEYEKDNFGETTTDISEPERVVNMYTYIKGEELINSLSVIRDNWDGTLSEELAEELREELTTIIKA